MNLQIARHFAISAALMPAPTHLLAATTEEAPIIEEVVVTATRHEQNAYQVPASLSVIEGHGLEERGIGDLVDVGKIVPNLTVTSFGAGHAVSANPFIRGIGTQDHLIVTDPGVGVYVDGVYLGRQVAQHWDLKNIERVEVLRGPQGTLYGRNSIGGALNIVTYSPGSHHGRNLSARVGTRGRLDVSTYFDSNLSDAIGITLSAGTKRRGGVGEFLNLPDADVEVGESREYSVRLALACQLASGVALTIAADANRGKNGLNPYTTLIDEVPGSAVYAAGYRNADTAVDPYDNNTGQLEQTRTTNAARGLSLRNEWLVNEWLKARILGSVRCSEYKAGLDDDALVDDFLRFPEEGNAEQTMLEATLLGDIENYDFVAGVHYFKEDGENVQEPTVFLGARGAFLLSQNLTSRAVFANIGRLVSERWRLAAGIRTTRDNKEAAADVGTGLVIGNRSWTETSWEISARYAASDKLATYVAVQNGYQSGQFPARPYCLFADPNCFVAGDNIKAINYEVGMKGLPLANLEINIAAFRTQYRDLPYQVSSTSDVGFETVNLIVEQDTMGIEWESTLYVNQAFSFRFAAGYLDVEIDRQRNVKPVAPLTPRITLTSSPELKRHLTDGSELAARLDYSWRASMWGEPSSDPRRNTRIGSRGLVNVNLSYTHASDAWMVSLYGRNVADVRYDQARVNTGDYVLRILSNDASEFGIRMEGWF